MAGIPGKRRRHSPDLKARILKACAEPGASVARIAMENGLNANLVFKWRRQASARSVEPMVAVAEFVPVLPMEAPLPMVSPTPSGDIRIAIRRGGTQLEIQWPLSGAASCADWLRDLLR